MQPTRLKDAQLLVPTDSPHEAPYIEVANDAINRYRAAQEKCAVSERELELAQARYRATDVGWNTKGASGRWKPEDQEAIGQHRGTTRGRVVEAERKLEYDRRMLDQEEFTAEAEWLGAMSLLGRI